MKTLMKNVLASVDSKMIGAGAFVATLLGVAVPSMAAATYDITPVTTGLTTELAANLPVILTIVGALIALGLAVKVARRFAKV